MTETIFFDLDGTLTDPKEGITRCIQHALTILDGDAPDTEELLWCIGPPLLQSFEQLLDAQRAPQALALYRERFSAIGLYENALYPGISTLLKNLQQAGHRLYIASSKPHIYVERILEHFDLADYFDAVFGAELDGTRSDKTQLLRYALDHTGHSPSQSCMVGDRKHDAIGAINNQLRFIGVLYGYGNAQELASAGARVLVEDAGALQRALQQVD